jgi:hypothetical protein
MTIWDILSDNQRVILWSDAEAGLIYTWNYSLVLQAWRLDDSIPGEIPSWEVVDIRTLPDKPKNARQELFRWHKERMREVGNGA